MRTDWVEQKTETRETVEVTAAKAKLLNEVRKELPVVQKEADGGVRPFKALSFQPIQGVGTFEAEFAVKGDDVIFHIWPWGYHDQDRSGVPRLPTFRKDFEKILRSSMEKVFANSKLELSLDGDVGAWFVRVVNGAVNQFHFQLSIKAASELHVALGGKLSDS